MNPATEILQELDQIAPSLAGIDRQMPNSLPAGYFEKLPNSILGRAIANNAFAAPDGYFDSLPDLILQKIRRNEVEQELSGIAPLLNTISKQPVAFVPEGYFEQLGNQTPASAPVIRFGGVRRFLNNALPYATAACLALAIWIGINQRALVNAEDNEALVAAPQIEDAIKSIDEQTIANYLEATSTVDAYSSLQSATTDTETLLKGMQSDVLEDYLKTMPTLITNDQTGM